jgi:hypothetical protein
VYEEATNKCAQRLLLGFSLEMLNDALVRYDLPSEQSRKKAAEALADKLLYDTATTTTRRTDFIPQYQAMHNRLYAYTGCRS